MVEIYYNSGQFANAVGYLMHYYTSPMKLYEELYGYYEKRHMEMLAHSRIKRYEILLEFFREQVLPGIQNTQEDKHLQLELFTEILLMDLFLREDLKSRPAFAVKQVQKNYRNQYEEYRKQHKLVHIEDFTFDIPKSVEVGKAIKEETTILFNYSDRDPLSNSASITRL